MNTSCIVLLSGGLDSTVLLTDACRRYGKVRALSINYGQRHIYELNAAAAVAAELSVEHRIVDLSPVAVLLGGSSQTDPAVPVPDGHYSDESMKATVVPNRNMILLSLAFAWAIATKSEAVLYAAHAGDHPIYPDCRPEFIWKLADAAKAADWHQVELLAPFQRFSKGEVAVLGASIKAPMHLSYSCYKGRARHCGKCGTCVERREAFQLAKLADPTVYEV